MSFIFVVGRPAWPRIEANQDFFRVVFGPFAFWIMFHDFENVLSKLIKAVDAAFEIIERPKK
jgi:hypothetical protein